MLFLKICNFLLWLSLSSVLLASSSYSVQLQTRGVVFTDTKQGKLTEVLLCSNVLCLFVEPRELELLGIDLGANTAAIFQSLNAMDDLDKSWVFTNIQQLNQIQPYR